jgi:hypothetical protein
VGTIPSATVKTQKLALTKDRRNKTLFSSIVSVLWVVGGNNSIRDEKDAKKEVDEGSQK